MKPTKADREAAQEWFAGAKAVEQKSANAFLEQSIRASRMDAEEKLSGIIAEKMAPERKRAEKQIDDLLGLVGWADKELTKERERARRERGMRQRLERTMREHGMCLCPAQDDTCVTKQALAASEALDKLEVEDA